MRSVHISALTVLALGALAPSAFAAQTFTFSNPFASGGASYAASQFETGGIAPATVPSAATLQNFYTGPVNLVAIGGTTAGSYGATYTLSTTSGGSVFTGSGNPSGTATTTIGGSLVFKSTAATSFGPAGTTLLTYAFTQGGLFGLNGFGFTPAGANTLTVTGPLVDLTGGPLDASLSKFAFSFPGFFNDASGKGMLHYTAGFTSSVQAVPEPASMGVLAIGAVALLRRRRRA